MTAADAINRIESVAPEVLEEHAGKTLEILKCDPSLPAL